MELDIQELYDSDYRIGTPYWGLIDGGAIDAEVCAEGTCGVCGHKGLEYKPFVRDNPRSYRAFCVCPKCNNAEEF